MTYLNRRQFVTVMGGLAALGVLSRNAVAGLFGSDKPKKEFSVHMSDADWKQKLSPEAYKVLREQGTERAFTSPLNDEHRAGTFYCAGCNNALFSSDQKFNSGTGWPSFWAPVDATAVQTDTDYKIGVPRTEVHCADCGGHLGHVFNDGPQPTGQRFCMNGVAMTFAPKSS